MDMGGISLLANAFVLNHQCRSFDLLLSNSATWDFYRRRDLNCWRDLNTKPTFYFRLHLRQLTWRQYSPASHVYIAMFIATLKSTCVQYIICQSHLMIHTWLSKSEKVNIASKWLSLLEVIKRAKVRNRYNQAPHLTQDTNANVTTSQLDIINESQEVSPFPVGDHKASTNRRAWKHNKTRQK